MPRKRLIFFVVIKLNRAILCFFIALIYFYENLELIQMVLTMKTRRIFMALLLCLCTMAVGAQCKRALVFGLGEQEDKTWGKINGDKDIEYIVPMLQGAGYTDIVVLKNSEATKAAMVAAFEAMAQRCAKGDVVYVHYSGHGQLMTDLDGDEQLKWSGRHAQWDEAWIPYDAYMLYCDKDKGEKHMCDDEVAALLAGIRKSIGKEGELMVVIDACHSGDATCGDGMPPVRGIGIQFDIPRDGSVAKKSKPVEEQWLTVSACRPYQLNVEMQSVQAGKLTYAIHTLGIDVLDKDAAELQQELARFMDESKSVLPQSPVVSGTKKQGK